MAKLGRQHGKYRQATRLLKLLEQLRSRAFGATLLELAEELGVTDRQIRRDLEALEEAGYSTDSSVGADGRARVQLTDRRSRSVALTVRERYVLLAVRRVFDVLEGTPFHEDVGSIYAKVAASLPEEQRADLAALGERFLFLPDGGTKAYEGKQDVLDALLTGVIRRVRVRYRYRPAAGTAHAGALEPYAMVLYKHGLYVIGCGTPDGEEARDRKPFVFAAERFEKAEHVRGAHFEVPESFQLNEFFHGAFGIFMGGTPKRVVVEFTAEVRPRIEARLWHQSQKLRRLKNGGVRLTFEAANLTQVGPWVRSWGAHARVVQPPELVEQIRADLAANMKLYADPKR